MAQNVRHLMIAAALGVALAGCGEDETKERSTAATVTAAPTASTPTAATTTPATTTAPPTIAGPSSDPVVVPASNRDVALLSDVRAARQPGFDRVVFEFRGEDTPGYDVRYIRRPVTQDGSGHEVEVAGEHVIEVRMENALDADLSKDSAPLTYTGPRRITPGLPGVTELVRTGGFEGVLTWVIGTGAREGFVVSTLQDPPRVVVDVATG